VNGRTRGEGGQVTAFVVVLVIALLALVGLVFDGGRYYAAQRQARNVAAAAARAGAQGLSEDALRATDATVVLDPHDAYQRAEAFLDRAGATGTVEVGLTTVTVTVTRTVSPVLLGVVGVGDRTLRATETAEATPGP
jgi:Flp pilus assembly protein TadG